ncbi:hypothetical protein H4582DRAFT_1901132, partial [Lactarius indigo]
SWTAAVPPMTLSSSLPLLVSGGGIDHRNTHSFKGTCEVLCPGVFCGFMISIGISQGATVECSRPYFLVLSLRLLGLCHGPCPSVAFVALQACRHVRASQNTPSIAYWPSRVSSAQRTASRS